MHPLRNSFRHAGKRDWATIAKYLKPVCTAASEAEALERFAEFSGKGEKRYPAIIKLWEHVWAEFVPFLALDREIRTAICTTDENVNRGHRLGWRPGGLLPPQLPDPAGRCRVKVERPGCPKDLDSGEGCGSVGCGGRS